MSCLNRQSKVTLKCDPNEPGNGTIPFFTGTALSPGTTLYVNISVFSFALKFRTCSKQVMKYSVQ